MNKSKQPRPSTKQSLLNVFGWLSLLAGVALYIFPVFEQTLGHNSGLLAFILIFVGVSLLKYRKDQLNR